MNKFKVGDRVTAYYTSCPKKNYGTIISIAPNCHLEIKYDLEEFIGWAHPKQCRKLKPKIKRVLYALVPSYGVYGVRAYFDKALAEKTKSEGMVNCDIVEFVEKGKK